MSYIFGKRSRGNLDTCHPDLILIAEEALKVSQVDFGISEGHRSVERQQELYASGRTKPGKKLTSIDGINKKGKHNYLPSRAFDFYCYVPGKKKLAYDLTHIMYVVGVITSTANRLLNEGKIASKVRSGANWDGDGELRYDQTFFDSPHIEIV